MKTFQKKPDSPFGNTEPLNDVKWQRKIDFQVDNDPQEVSGLEDAAITVNAAMNHGHTRHACCGMNSTWECIVAVKVRLIRPG
jgi:hypothetical protein